MLCCFALLFFFMTLLASFFLPSHLSLKHVFCVHLGEEVCMNHSCMCTCTLYMYAHSVHSILTYYTIMCTVHYIHVCFRLKGQEQSMGKFLTNQRSELSCYKPPLIIVDVLYIVNCPVCCYIPIFIIRSFIVNPRCACMHALQ